MHTSLTVSASYFSFPSLLDFLMRVVEASTLPLFFCRSSLRPHCYCSSWWFPLVLRIIIVLGSDLVWSPSWQEHGESWQPQSRGVCRLIICKAEVKRRALGMFGVHCSKTSCINVALKWCSIWQQNPSSHPGGCFRCWLAEPQVLHPLELVWSLISHCGCTSAAVLPGNLAPNDFL